ncbi:hypothetical protein BD779DRAFT_1478552 [Infundibulicybe gibba]|nr:hypothetical protein BD779DRAFT_1478552 [Infundibulicybe gibba]
MYSYVDSTTFPDGHQEKLMLLFVTLGHFWSTFSLIQGSEKYQIWVKPPRLSTSGYTKTKTNIEDGCAQANSNDPFRACSLVLPDSLQRSAPPPRHRSILYSYPHSTPTPPLLNPASHVASILTKQNLQASTATQAMKRAEEQLGIGPRAPDPHVQIRSISSELSIPRSAPDLSSSASGHAACLPRFYFPRMPILCPPPYQGACLGVSRWPWHWRSHWYAGGEEGLTHVEVRPPVARQGIQGGGSFAQREKEEKKEQEYGRDQEMRGCGWIAL